jgi:hypothetical protein
MDFEYDKSWACLTTIFGSKLTAKDAWNKFIDFHEQLVSKSYWKDLRELDIDAEQTNIVAWFQQTITDNPIPKGVVAIWIGILKFVHDNREIPTIYFIGADNYDKEDIEWACDPTFLPENRYSQPSTLQQIDDIARTDKENYAFFDWILPLAYSTFTFDEIIRNKLDKKLLLKHNNVLHVALGHDNGDYMNLQDIEN